MHCPRCGVEVEGLESICLKCGHPRPRPVQPVVPWVQNGLKALAHTRSSAPRELWLHALSTVLAVGVWRFWVSAWLSTPKDFERHLRWLLPDATDAELSTRVQDINAVIATDDINRVTLMLGTWVLVFAAVRLVSLAMWRLSIARGLISLQHYLDSHVSNHPGVALTNALNDESGLRNLRPELAELYREMASGVSDPTTAFNDLTNALVERRQRAAALSRVVVWAIPILGFIGTVRGISRAINGFQGLSIAGSGASQFVAKFQSAMTTVMDGLSGAFGTTLVALVVVLPVALALESVSMVEQLQCASGRGHILQTVWQAIGPAWRADVSVLGLRERVSAESLAASVHELSTRLGELATRLNVASSTIESLREGAVHLSKVVDSLEPVQEDSPPEGRA